MRIKINQKSFRLNRILFNDGTGFDVIQYVGDGFLLRISPLERTLRINNTSYSAEDALSVCKKFEQNLTKKCV
jgi:hypothetical protein